MTPHKSLSLIFTCLYLLNYETYGFSKKAISDSLETKIDFIMKDYSGNNRPGATIGIIKDGQIVFKKGYGMANIKKKVPNSPDLSYKIASVSKQFTAAIISSLVQSKKLALNEDIRKYIPEFPDYGKPITINNLLYHTSGIRDHMVLMWLTGKSFEAEFTNKDALAMINRQSTLNFTTGHRCVYSNSNYILLAEIINRVTGQPLSAFANNNLFKELGMTHSRFNDTQSKANQALAISYGKKDDDYYAYKNENKTVGDGGMSTTLDDLVLWDKSFYDKASLSQTLLNRGKLDNGNILTYGMGIMTGSYKGEPTHMHPGAFLGYRTEILRFPRKNISIICLGNDESINPEILTRRIADAYIFNDNTNVGEEKPTATAPIQNHEFITGKYEVAPNVFIDIKYEDNQLSGQVAGQPKNILYLDSTDIYKIGKTGDRVQFHKDASGLINQLTVFQKQGKTLAKRLELVPPDLFKNYVGSYYSDEQKATYVFYAKDNALWFKVGTNPPVKAEILKKYNRLYFSYQNLESATITFDNNGSGQIEGFTLSSGRVPGLKFIKKEGN